MGTTAQYERTTMKQPLLTHRHHLMYFKDGYPASFEGTLHETATIGTYLLKGTRRDAGIEIMFSASDDTFISLTHAHVYCGQCKQEARDTATEL